MDLRIVGDLLVSPQLATAPGDANRGRGDVGDALVNAEVTESTSTILVLGLMALALVRFRRSWSPIAIDGCRGEACTIKTPAFSLCCFSISQLQLSLLPCLETNTMPRFRVPGKAFIALMLLWGQVLSAQEVALDWNQWRGPNRDGVVTGEPWPASLGEGVLTEVWKANLPPSYSGPVVSGSFVFTTATDDNLEVVYALDRETGNEVWRAQWPGTLSVPFFAASNGSWIRATPAYDGESLFVAGMRDVLVSLNGKTGEEQWRVDFVEELKTPLPAFGFVSSPLLDGEFLYVQAGASFVKIDKHTGKIIWRTLQDEGGMSGSAFSSPIITTLAGQRQLIVQTRAELAGVDPENGAVLWQQPVPSFRGMNILTPVRFENSIFTSAYQKETWLFSIFKSDKQYEVNEAWSNSAKGYMSTPVIVDGHAYLHLQNQRFACIDLRTGQRTWTSKPFGKYCSLVAQGDRILALDQAGILLLLKANPEEFEVLDQRKVSDQETWAHLAVSGDDLFVRELNGLKKFRWSDSSPAPDP